MSKYDFMKIMQSGDEAAFLSGPYIASQDVIVEQFTAASWNIAFSNLLDNMCLENDPGMISDLVDTIIVEHGVLEYMALSSPVLILDAISSDEVHSGVMAVTRSGSGFEIIGAYVGAERAVREDWQGQGVGTRLVVQIALVDQALPAWTLEEAVYSEAGVATHLKAYRALRSELDLQHEAAGPEL